MILAKKMNLGLHRAAVILSLMLWQSMAWAMTMLPAINAPASDVFLPGKFIWFDLASPDKELQKQFYQSIFSWSFHSPNPSADLYELIIIDGQVIGGIFQFSAPDDEQYAAIWIAQLSVADVDAAVNKGKQHGGTVEAPAVTIDGRGRNVLLRDPAAALFGVIKSASGDPTDVEAAVGYILWQDLYARNIETMQQFNLALAAYCLLG